MDLTSRRSQFGNVRNSSIQCEVERGASADPVALEAKEFREEKRERPEHLFSKDQVLYLKEIPWLTYNFKEKK